MLRLRIAIMALIWASALLAPAAAAPFNGGADNRTVAAERIAYLYDVPDAGPSTPGPTDPNGPST